MPQSAPSGRPDKSDNRATLTVAVPSKVLVTSIRALRWIFFLGAIVVLALNGVDPTVLAPFVPRF
ncbi:hypothetical protein [Nonomuraea maritima]|uniref:hypothetical protein n=1 Tax=Nonomuraea maritima TaxID=683260 RepID=UPI00371F168D